MKERFEKMMGYIITAIIFFYGLPLICALINFPFYTLLPMLYVCIAIVIGFMFGKVHGGDWLLCLIIMVVFIPCIYMFFNESVWIYVLVCGIGSFIGLMIGTLFKNRKI